MFQYFRNTDCTDPDRALALGSSRGGFIFMFVWGGEIKITKYKKYRNLFNFVRPINV